MGDENLQMLRTDFWNALLQHLMQRGSFLQRGHTKHEHHPILCREILDNPKAYEVIDVKPDMTEEYNSIFTVAQSHPFIWRRDSNNVINEFSPLFDNAIPRKGTNKIDNIFIETGAIYGFNLKNYLKERRRTFGRTYPFILSKYETLDIDDSEDLKLANLLYPLFKNQLFN